VLAELDGAIEELSVTGQELHEQTAELTATRQALEAERERYQARGWTVRTRSTPH
jgi:hypothetical protein